MVLLTITPAALKALQVRQKLLGDRALHDDGGPSLSAPAVGRPISHGQLVELSTELLAHAAAPKDGRYDLETLLKGARIYVPPPAPKPAKTPEYEALMARLRASADRQAYSRMVNHDGDADASEDDDEVSFSDVNRQLTLVINVLVSVVACSIGIWVTAWHWAAPARLALSLLGSGAVAVAEVAIYMGYIKRVGDAKRRERARGEQKEVLETWVVDGKKSPARNAGLRHRKGKHG